MVLVRLLPRATDNKNDLEEMGLKLSEDLHDDVLDVMQALVFSHETMQSAVQNLLYNLIT